MKLTPHKILKPIDVEFGLKWKVFLSLLPCSTGYVGAVREHQPHDYWLGSELFLLKYDHDFNILSERSLGGGEDPRLFHWKNEFWLLTQRYEQFTNDYVNWLVNVESGKRIRLIVDPFIFHGKNWVPVPHGDDLYIIRSLQPLVILKLADENGRCDIWKSDASPDHNQTTEIGERRGGTNAVFRDDCITGYGHFSRTIDLHTVFRYDIYPMFGRVEYTDYEVEGVDGMNVIDPTSFWDGHVVLNATPRRWNGLQPLIQGIFKEEA